MYKKMIQRDKIVKKEEVARNQIIKAILFIAELLKSSLGPLGMRKMIIEKYGTIIISNDGLTIIKDIGVAHPAAESLIRLGKSFINDVGDGLKTTILIIGELLKRGLKLIEQNFHPVQVISGYNLALEKSIYRLKEISIPTGKINDKHTFRVAKNALNGKFSNTVIEHLANIAVQAVNAIITKKSGFFEINIEQNIQFQKVDGGGILDTKIVKGVLISKDILNSKMPRKVKDAKIALIDEKLYIEKPAGDDTKVEINIANPAILSEMSRAHENHLLKKVQAIINSGANVLITEKGIDKIIISKLVEENILTVRRAKPEHFKMLSKACGANIIGNAEDLGPNDLGFAENVEEVIIGKNKFVKIEGCLNPKAICILIRGGSWYVCEEVERLLKNTIKTVARVFNNGSQGIVGGGGATEIELAKYLRTKAKSIKNKEQIIVETFGEALEVIPKTLSINFGLDPIDTLSNLRYLHSKGEIWKGLDANTLEITNVLECEIIEPVSNKISILKYATEFANSILRIDGILFSKTGLEKIKENL